MEAEEIAAELRTIATWLDGPRRRKVLALAEQVLAPPPSESQEPVVSVGDQEEAGPTA